VRTVFVGASSLGHACCQALLEAGKQLDHIVTMPRDFEVGGRAGGRRHVQNVLHADFVALAEEYAVPITVTDGNLRPHEPMLRDLAPEVVLVAGWYHLVPRSVLEIPSQGVAGLHGSLLPKYRGNAPLVWAMINGERRTGVSLFWFDDGVDTGDVIDQRSFDIDEQDTIAEVVAKASSAAVSLVLDNYDPLAAGTAAATPQDHSSSTTFGPRTPADGEIDWSWPVERIRDFIRAQAHPYPGAFTRIGGKVVRIWDADVVDDVTSV
jgi:methionyl-tRNA formyltransferase